MPLSCDCYAGCWADHSEGWQRIGDVTSANHWYKLAQKCLPYGTYVLMSDGLRVETEENIGTLMDYVRREIKPDTKPDTYVGLEWFVKMATRTEPTRGSYATAYARLGTDQTMRLLHAAMGLCTEAGEFVDALKKHIFYGKPIDTTNLIEELGDSSWYERIAADALKVKYLDMLQRNVAKLQARFPDKFTEADAINRDLDKERQILEGGK